MLNLRFDIIFKMTIIFLEMEKYFIGKYKLTKNRQIAFKNIFGFGNTYFEKIFKTFVCNFANFKNKQIFNQENF